MLRNRASSPAVSSLRPPRFKGTAKPPSQQTPPSAQQPPPSQQQERPTTPTVIPSSIPSQASSEPDVAHDADPIEDFSEYEDEGAETPNTANGSQNAFQKMTSSQMSSGSQRFGGLKQPPKWTKEEDAVLIRGVREGWSATEIARELGPGPVRRTGSAIRGRKKALIEKFNLEARAAKPTPLHVESRRRWTPAEMAIIQQGVRDGSDTAALQQRLKDRTLKSIEHKIQKRKLLSKDPIRNGAEPSAKKSKARAPKVDKSKDKAAQPSTPGDPAGDEMAVDETVQEETMQDETVQKEMAVDEAAPNETAQKDAGPMDQVMTDDVEEYPAYPPEPQERVATQSKEAEGQYTPIEDGLDFSTLPTAFVKLPANARSGVKAGRLRRPTAARKRITRSATANVDHNTTAHAQDAPAHGNNATAEDHGNTANDRDASVIDHDRTQADNDATVNDYDAIMNDHNAPRDDHGRTADDYGRLYDSDGVETSQPEPRAQRQSLFHDWTQKQRWRDCLRVAGGDEDAARRQFKEANLTANMYDAILRKDQATIDSIKAERRQMELREAIEEGRARRKVPLPGASVNADAEDVDDEVLREEYWEIFMEKEDTWSLPSEDHSSAVDDDDEEEDMIRDREIEEVDDDEEDLVPDRTIEEVEDDGEDVSHDREIEEVMDEEIRYKAPPPLPGHHFTPIQAMRATVVDGGLTTPVATSEKPLAFAVDSKLPTSSIPTTASETTAASISRESERSDSKRSRRRARDATQRRQSGGSRSSQRRSRMSMSEMGSAAGQMGPPGSMKEAENPFMKIVRNAHIPPAPRRREEQQPARRRGTPSPPTWFASENESEDSSEESE